ncbi:hypothetical protein [Castellaniella defragrans]|uniref:Uncharacterized protein n=1 Tax=Castellaniella defragrans TaxID=75697 RepID=A0A7W9WNU7_CASDE|nr:hypothetical protein [Castellaniella defragrans]MBB6083135.1 hypothetical protein [Castellaniella defragrans]
MTGRAEARLKQAVARNGGRPDGVLARNDVLAASPARAVLFVPGGVF